MPYLLFYKSLAVNSLMYIIGCNGKGFRQATCQTDYFQAALKKIKKLLLIKIIKNKLN